MLPSKNSHLFSKKKKCNDILKEWQTSFSTSQKKGQIFLDFKDKKQHVIIPTYAKGSSWLPSIEFTSTLCAQFTHMTTGHVPISKYQQCFFPNSLISCPCGQAAVQTCEHIIMQYDLHDLSSRPCNIIINSFVHFLVDNPTAFSFNNGWTIHALHLLFSTFQLPFLSFFSFSLSSFSLSLSYLSRYNVSTTACLRALCNKSFNLKKKFKLTSCF